MYSLVPNITHVLFIWNFFTKIVSQQSCVLYENDLLSCDDSIEIPVRENAQEVTSVSDSQGKITLKQRQRGIMGYLGS